MAANDTAGETMNAAAPAGASALGYVVAIGASAGGLEALRTVLGGVKADGGATFVVVAHRAPGHGERLVELLQPYIELPIREAVTDTLLEPNTILVVPAAADVVAVDSHLRLVELPA